VGLDVEVISGEREGRLAFSSVQHAFDLTGRNAIVADIGGGSTEIVFATGNLIESIFSTPLGAVRLTEQFGLGEGCEPLDFDKGLQRLEDEVAACLKKHTSKPLFAPHFLVGCGGTFTTLAELVMAHVRCELECGRDIVVLVDSMTRLVRAFNLHGSGARRTLSGGLDAKAMEIPRRFFGLARAIENGGSVTVIGTALIETGSRLDDYVFEELKSTGNSEIVLDRSLAEARIFPAINLIASSTRKEELLYEAEQVKQLVALRRWLAKGSPKAAMIGLLNLLAKTPTNDELLKRIKVS
jgi:hypothetical protein